MGLATILAENHRLRQQVAEQELCLAQQAESLAELKAKVEELIASNEDLAQRLELLRLKSAGRKNERDLDDKIIPLPFPNPVLTPPPRLPGKENKEEEEEEKESKPQKPRIRRNLAENSTLSKRKVECKVAPSASCQKCGGALKVFGTSTSYRLEWVPGHFETLVVERERCACPSCPSEGVMVAPDPGFALPRALCGNGLLARVLVDKFADRIPLNLQAKRMQREGLEISVSTLCDWVCGGARFLRPIVEAIRTRLMAGAWGQVDDTGLPVQDGVDGHLRKGRLWAFTDQKEVLYTFTGTKEGKHPATFLSTFQGKVLLADRGSEFNQVVLKKDLERAACWSHLRRYFFDCRTFHPAETKLALGTIRDLFSLEDGLVGAPLEVIRETRQRESRPLVEGLFAWMMGLSQSTRPKSLLGAALQYGLNGKEEFEVFLRRPEIPMHNNRSELALRGPVVGRKQWLFAGSEGGALAAADLFTVVESCVMQAIDCEEYLTDIFGRLDRHPVNRVHELTPLYWRLSRERSSPA
jgi:transposase